MDVTFDVPIINDNILEGSEDFALVIDQASLPDRIIRGIHGLATVTIVDDDSECLCLNFKRIGVYKKKIIFCMPTCLPACLSICLIDQPTDHLYVCFSTPNHPSCQHNMVKYELKLQ